MLVEFILLAAGLVILVFGADLLIKGARSIARSFGISTLIIGLTVVAFGTSAPELFVSVAAAFKGTADVAVGNIIGSNIFNILVIIGIAGIIAPVHISPAVIKREMPLMLIVLGLFLVFSFDLILSRVEGAVFFVGILSYLVVNYFLVKRAKQRVHALENCADPSELEDTHYPRDIAFVLLGLGGLVLGAELIVSNAVVIAKNYGVSDLVVAVTLIAVGTSLPELATTFVAAMKGEPDLAVGNAVGSNIFNVLCVLGVTSSITPLNVNPVAVSFDLPYMFISCLLVWPLMLARKKFGRIEGLILLGGYAAYVYFQF